MNWERSFLGSPDKDKKKAFDTSLIPRLGNNAPKSLGRRWKENENVFIGPRINQTMCNQYHHPPCLRSVPPVSLRYHRSRLETENIFSWLWTCGFISPRLYNQCVDGDGKIHDGAEMPDTMKMFRVIDFFFFISANYIMFLAPTPNGAIK